MKLATFFALLTSLSFTHEGLAQASSMNTQWACEGRARAVFADDGKCGFYDCAWFGARGAHMDLFEDAKASALSELKREATERKFGLRDTYIYTCTQGSEIYAEDGVLKVKITGYLAPELSPSDLVDLSVSFRASEICSQANKVSVKFLASHGRAADGGSTASSVFICK